LHDLSQLLIFILTLYRLNGIIFKVLEEFFTIFGKIIVFNNL